MGITVAAYQFGSADFREIATCAAILANRAISSFTDLLRIIG